MIHASSLDQSQEALPPPVTLYAIRQVVPSDHGFLVRHPQTGKLLNNRSYQGGYCERPITVPREEALELLATFQELVPSKEVWEVTEAPKACPQCQRDIWANDLDFLYPQSRDYTRWRAGCNEHDFGCGFELLVEGTRQDMLQRWNGHYRG